jgi:hypothetical protein
LKLKLISALDLTVFALITALSGFISGFCGFLLTALPPSGFFALGSLANGLLLRLQTCFTKSSWFPSAFADFELLALFECSLWHRPFSPVYIDLCFCTRLYPPLKGLVILTFVRLGNIVSLAPRLFDELCLFDIVVLTSVISIFVFLTSVIFDIPADLSLSTRFNRNFAA